MLRPRCYGVKLVEMSLSGLVLKVLAIKRPREDAAKRVS